MPRAATQHFILTLHNIEDNQAQLDEWVSWENQAVRYISVTPSGRGDARGLERYFLSDFGR